MINFSEVKEIKLSDSEKTRLMEFSRSEEWKVLKNLVEAYAMQNCYNFAGGAEVDPKMIQGFIYYWQKVVRFIEVVNVKKGNEQIGTN